MGRRRRRVIPVRRIKHLGDRTTFLAESEEYFNSADEFDVAHLNIARPGELYRVVDPDAAVTFETTTFSRFEVSCLLKNWDWVYVIEQEDFSSAKQSRRGVRQLQVSKPPTEWWFRTLNNVFHLYEDNNDLDLDRDIHLSFNNPDIVASYAYEGRPTPRPWATAHRDIPHLPPMMIHH